MSGSSLQRFFALFIATLLLPAVLANTLHAEVKLPGFFGDHMVLQRKQKLAIWGWAKPGETVTVQIANIKSVSFKRPLLISGPLHFLDYWSPAVRSVFWKFLATFSNGPGIIATDVFRNEALLGPLQTVEGFARPDVRCLKSRLEITQDRLA